MEGKHNVRFMEDHRRSSVNAYFRYREHVSSEKYAAPTKLLGRATEEMYHTVFLAVRKAGDNVDYFCGDKTILSEAIKEIFCSFGGPSREVCAKN